MGRSIAPAGRKRAAWARALRAAFLPGLVFGFTLSFLPTKVAWLAFLIGLVAGGFMLRRAPAHFARGRDLRGVQLKVDIWEALCRSQLNNNALSTAPYKCSEVLV